MPAPKNHAIIRAPYMASRSVPVSLDAATGQPSTLDEATRSVEVIASTEAPAMVMDWERWEVVREVLLMSGCRLPASGKAPLLDTHSRDSVSRVLGSFRAAHVGVSEHGPSLIGRTHYSTVKEADDAYTKVKEGHVTDVSIGYEVLSHIWLKEGESAVVEGKTYTGPLRIGTDWALAELSLCPIGADPNAKFRHQPPAVRQKKEKAAMPKEKAGGKPAKAAKTEKRSGILARLRSVLIALGLRAEEEKPEEERQDVELVDENGNPVEPAELSEEELITVVEGLEEVLADAEEELASQEEKAAPEDEEEERASARKRGKRSSVRNLSPTQAAQAERARVLALQNMARAHSLPEEITSQLIESGASLTAAKARVFDMRNQTQIQNAVPGFHVATGRTEQEKYRSAAFDSLLMRCGLPLWKHEPGSEEFRREQPGQRQVREAAPGAQELLGLPLSMLCREALTRSGQRVTGHVGQLVSRALTTTDLPMLLVETSRRTLMEAFDSAPETWRAWAQTGIATDFKKSKAVGLEGDVKPVRKHEYGEYTEGRLAENAEEWFIEEFGRMMVISRQAIINDDLNALTEIPREYGLQTAEMVGDVAYAALLSTPNLMGDGNPLFSAVHNNIFTGRNGVPDVTKLGDIVTAMKKQVDSFGRVKPQLPRFFIAPVSLEVAAEQFFNTQLQGGAIIGTQAQPLIHNPYGGNYFSRVYDHRLDAVSESDWYLAAQRSTVSVFFLGGVESPYIEEQIDFDSDAIKSKVRMDVGAKAMRWITLAKATA